MNTHKLIGIWLNKTCNFLSIETASVDEKRRAINYIHSVKDRKAYEIHIFLNLESNSIYHESLT